MGFHARWVHDNLDKARPREDGKSKRRLSAPGALHTPDGEKEVLERPPLIHGGPAAAKKSSSGSSTSYASTTSSLLMKYFPTRYFILKSLTRV
jgi:hypothetical protein